MKKIIFLLALVCGIETITAQTNSVEKIYSYLLNHSSGIDLQNKLVMVNIWSSTSLNSRECNKAMDKTMQTYQYAKLKGGAKGMVAFDICIDNTSNAIQIIRTKDGIKHMLELPNDKNFSFNEGNFTFDANGKLIAQNTPSTKIYETVHQLITR
jgi:hypothetical protein